MAVPISKTTYKDFLVSTPSPYVTHVEINRPSHINAFTPSMWRELGEIFTQLSTDPDVRAIVFSGAGERGFSSGLDVVAAGAEIVGVAGENADAGRRAWALRRTILNFQNCISKIEECEKPVICVLHGICYGLALDMATCADVRICANTARLSVKEVDIGMAADVGSLSRLPRIVGSMSWVKDICLTAREFGAEEAVRVGLASRALPGKKEAVEAALELAALMALKSPVAVQGTKDILNHSKNHTVEDNLRYTAVWNSAALQSDDFTSAISSALSKKKPTFEKL